MSASCQENRLGFSGRGSELIGIVVTRELIKRSVQGLGTRLVARQITKFIPLGGQIVAATIGYWVMRRMAMTHVDDCFEVACTARGITSAAAKA